MSLHTQLRTVAGQRPAQRHAAPPAAPTLQRGSIRLVPISGSEWRISDATIPFGEAGSVLGFAERIDGTSFDVLKLGHGHGITRMTAGSLDDILAYFSSVA
ncbi:hypothetical protein [Rathayibacter soli]|uniref:hypothetical protein n=1 Tax=Rathayibacter soli TaxID=3144168 RepID=UPI0027E45A5C|nr:hypothetical protein [Glaciibacter superstes]